MTLDDLQAAYRAVLERLARALPSHRHCDEHIRGHQACLDEARAILRNLESVEEATRP